MLPDSGDQTGYKVPERAEAQPAQPAQAVQAVQPARPEITAENNKDIGYGKVSGSTTAELWKKAPDDSESEPRPLKITYSIENADEDEEVDETVFEDPEAAERPRLLVPLQSVLGLKALCEREFIRTEAVTEMLNQCRTAYYKELLYLREQLILAAEPEKQIMPEKPRGQGKTL
eukprot:symbB.v1.2.006071.t1/scaffold332.1/size322744/6